MQMETEKTGSDLKGFQHWAGKGLRSQQNTSVFSWDKLSANKKGVFFFHAKKKIV